MSERSEARERIEQCGVSERVSGASERASGRASGPLLTSRFQEVLNHVNRHPSLRSAGPLHAKQPQFCPYAECTVCIKKNLATDAGEE